MLRNDLAGSIDRQSIIDFELAVELEDKAVLETLPAASPSTPDSKAHTKHDRPGIAYRHALARTPRRLELETVPLNSVQARAYTCMLSTLTIRKGAQ